VTTTVNAWNTGLTASLTITNTGPALNGWTLGFTLPPGQTITSGWNATYSPASGAVTARNASYNGAVATGASVGIGFQATHTGNSAAPTAFTLNGAACATG
jgi:acetylxylan esterase